MKSQFRLIFKAQTLNQSDLDPSLTTQQLGHVGQVS
jgi:hypothetical protein